LDCAFRKEARSFRIPQVKSELRHTSTYNTALRKNSYKMLPGIHRISPDNEHHPF
jgi:hypothetical protein